MSAIADLAAFIATPRPLADATRAAVRLHIVDTLGALIAATRTAEGQALLRFRGEIGAPADMAANLMTLCALTRLSEIDDADDAIAWQLHLEQWWQTFGHLTRERTMFRNGQFGFTHDRLRKAWLLIRKVTRDSVLFTWITYGNPRTTSPLEGGYNSRIRDLLRRHRGMSEAHRRRAVEWFLVLQQIGLDEALTLALTPATPEADNDQPDEAEDIGGPALYDTGLDATEGLWERAGWAGRG